MKTFLAWLLGLGTLAGAIAIWFSRRNPIDNLKDALEVQKLKEQVAQDTAKVEELKGKGDAAALERRILEGEIAESKRAALLIASESPTKIYEMSDAEIAKSFTDAGL